MSWHGSFPQLDRQLDALRWFGMPIGLWIGFLAVLLFLARPALAIPVALLALATFASHLLLSWHARAWTVAQGCWALIAVGVAIAGHPSWRLSLLALIPLAALALMTGMQARVQERLTGTPPRSWKQRRITPVAGPCRVCGRRDAQVIAPRYVMSVVFMSFRFPGRFRCLCPADARLHALPATLFTAALGWWGFPWGLLWTPQAIAQNLAEGGVAVDSAELEAMWQREVLEGGGSDYLGALGAAFGLIVVPAVILVPLMPHLARLLFR